tara:strand:+ start:1136 stop:1978 length:843 start_codon:yes stop_codon:yes gene_type:complete
MNIDTAITEGTKILESNFISSAKLDSEILLAKVINKDREYLIINGNKKLEKSDFKYFKKLILQRSFKKPISHLTNKKFFWNSEFYVTRDTLIPRPDTELIVQNVLDLTRHKNKLNILDIGIGSGCILISILKEKKNFIGTGIDVCKKCINISKINAYNLGVSSRIKFYETNVDKFNLGKYDLIVSNPPYIKKYNINNLEKDVSKYEPRLALSGGLDGLSEIRKVIIKSSELIKRNGKLFLEIGFDQKDKVIKLFKKEGFYINSTLKDFANNDRCIIGTKL